VCKDNIKEKQASQIWSKFCLLSDERDTKVTAAPQNSGFFSLKTGKCCFLQAITLHGSTTAGVKHVHLELISIVPKRTPRKISNICNSANIIYFKGMKDVSKTK